MALLGFIPWTNRLDVFSFVCRGFVNLILFVHWVDKFAYNGCVQKVWLDKSTGGVCLSISAKGLVITGIDDRRYWNHIPTEESRWDVLEPIKVIFHENGEIFGFLSYSIF